MNAVALCAGILTVVACSSSRDTGSRTYHHEQGYSVREPIGWSRHVDRGVAVYGGKGEEAKHTIVIRSAPRPSRLGDRLDATPENIELQTRVAITALPGAHMEGTRQLQSMGGPAEELAFTFRPQSAQGAAYQRRHVVIVGHSKVFHVFYTAPVGETVDAEEFDAVVSSLREET